MGDGYNLGPLYHLRYANETVSNFLTRSWIAVAEGGLTPLGESRNYYYPEFVEEYMGRHNLNTKVLMSKALHTRKFHFLRYHFNEFSGIRRLRFKRRMQRHQRLRAMLYGGERVYRLKKPFPEVSSMYNYTTNLDAITRTQNRARKR